MWQQLKDASMNIPYVGGWCEGFVEMAWGQGAMHKNSAGEYYTTGTYPSATAAWDAQPNKHTDRPPAGITVPVYLALGNVPAGHTAIALSDGYIASSTQAGYHSAPYYHKSLDDMIAVYGKYNGGATYLGWGEHVGTVQVVHYVNPNASDDEIRAAYQEILERPADDSGLAHYRNYTNDFVRQDLLNSAEYKTVLANKQAQADAAAAAQADAEARAADAAKAAQEAADATAKAQAEAEARQKAIDAQKEAEAHTVPVQNIPTPPKSPTLYDFVADLVKVVINWLQSWKKS